MSASRSSKKIVFISLILYGAMFLFFSYILNSLYSGIATLCTLFCLFQACRKNMQIRFKSEDKLNVQLNIK
jgi:hypothetical protein